MSKIYPKFKAAAVQAAPVYLDLERTVEKTCSLIDEAASNGAKLVAFPEAFIPGYPWWIWFSTPGYGIQFYEELYKNAVEIPSMAVRKISECSKKNRVYVCVSVSELDGGSLYLTQLWFNPNGDLIGKHRKLKPTNAERYIWGDGDGSMMPCFKTELGNLGGLECAEHLMPLNIAAMNSLNEQVHVSAWPAFFPGDENLFSIPPCEVSSKFYAVSNQTFVLMSSQIYTKEMLEKFCITDSQKEEFQPLVDFGGGRTCIFGPNGKIISNEIAPNEEGIAYADIDLGQIPSCKYFYDFSGHYSNQSLSLNFNQKPQPTVRKNGNEKINTILSYDDLQNIE
ncbi:MULTISPECIES: carbon-nitrogen hydrolase family protein [Clostridium]|uniref:Nitrilase n=2 Tax=Clostridium TaxID=1485 RepID=A0AAV3W395_9CLOT|nr:MULTISPECIES: carbon-nitrogen hydrolase family protein [Clostridium]NRY63247.1 cyanide dihydratase [Clostridium beijerinckii]OOM57231.1 nitrilase [Clostridium beijerinckii]QES73430.1 carbon-nitrogen hydrolase family protein [Clostridium diolis]GEA32818.1 nitrilase [Clostridium diolis]